MGRKWGQEDRGEEENKTVSEKKASRNLKRCIFQGPPQIIKTPDMLRAITHRRVGKWREIQGGRWDRQTQVMWRGLPYLIIVIAEHVSPPGPHRGISEVRVTS